MIYLAITHPEDHKVYIIDELDRSLHSLLTRQLLENYLASCSHESRSQLLFTTYDMLLTDQEFNQILFELRETGEPQITREFWYMTEVEKG